MDCGTYTRHKVKYDVEQGDTVAAYLLIPNSGSGRLPAVFCHHQHASNWDIGKSEVVGLGGSDDQAFAAELAHKGYVVLAPDALGFEERKRHSDGRTGAWLELATRLVQGKTLLAKVLHDVSVGVDYLQSLPEVDFERIGFMGHSYGGRMAIWAPALDRRIKASVSSCGCTSYRDCLTGELGIQLEFSVPGILQFGDVGDIVRLIEPSSLMILAATADKWSTGAEELFEYARSSFSEGQLQLRLHEGGHSLTTAMRDDAFAFLDNQLRDQAAQN